MDDHAKDALQSSRRIWLWLLAGVALILISGGLAHYVLATSDVRYVYYDPQDASFPIEITGYYGYNGERVDFRHVIECRESIYLGANDYGRMTWKANTKLFARHNSDGSTLLYGFHAGSKTKFGVADFSCGAFHENPDLEIERDLQIAWIDDIETFGSVYYARSRWEPPTDFSGLITRGQISARRISEGVPDPVDPMIHWAYPMMHMRGGDALAFAHAEHFKAEIVRGGFYIHCIALSKINQTYHEAGYPRPRTNPTPTGLVEHLCQEIGNLGARYVPLEPVKGDPALVVPNFSVGNSIHFYSSPAFLRAVANGRRPITLRTQFGDVPFYAAENLRHLLGYANGTNSLCINIDLPFLRLSSAEAPRLLNGD